MNQASIEKITNAAIEIMVRRANIESRGSFTAADIVSTVAADPHGNTAHYLANLIVTGINVYPAFA